MDEADRRRDHCAGSRRRDVAWRTDAVADQSTYGVTDLPTDGAADLPADGVADLPIDRSTDLPTDGVADLPLSPLLGGLAMGLTRRPSALGERQDSRR